MAEKIELEVKFDESKSRMKQLEEAGGFSGKRGRDNLVKLQNFFSTLDGVDLKKLDGEKLEKYLNLLGKIRSILNSTALSLNTYSQAYEEQYKKTQEANKKLSQSQDQLNESLRRQKTAVEQYKKALDDNQKDYSFYDKKTNKPINRGYHHVIAQAYDQGNLGIKNGETILSDKKYADAIKNLGLDNLAAADKQVDADKAEVNIADANLKAEQVKLENTPMGVEMNPLTKEIFDESEKHNDYIKKTKTAEADRAEAAINLSAAGIDDTSRALDRQGTSLGKAFKQFTIYAVGLRLLKKAVNEAKKTIKDLDKYLTEQAMVTGKTRKETYALLTEYQALAKQLGTTSKEVAQVATQYMRQGKTTEDAMHLTEAAISAAKVASISATESVTYLTTALNGFQLSANDAMLVSDKFAAIAAQSASSYEELAIALSKVASQANLAGMSIDYTTALLAKGLETTREAPETIGTALKTVIARMREMGDYGTTLEGDTDVNNVESQLAYVGIALKNNRGELRSTEEVLDELGKKWDELSVNQQAAIAKALAGTRQQSRLIAMMQDYERVTELQDIAQRSQGATLAQMETYLQGMDAALNKISIAWEKIVTAVVNSEAVINIISAIAAFLDKVAKFLSTDFGVVSTLTIIAGLTTTILANKAQEYSYSKMQQMQENQIREAKLKRRQEQIKILLAEKQAVIEAKKQTVEDKKQLAYDILKKKLQEQGISADKASLAQKQIENDLKKEEAQLEIESAELKDEQLSNEYQLSQLESTGLQTWMSIGSVVSMVVGMIGSLVDDSKVWLALMTAIAFTLKLMPTIIKATQLASKVFHKQEVKDQTKENGLKMMGGVGKIISQLGVYGIPIAIAFAAIFGTALAISAAANGAKKSSEEQINEMSASIYNLEKSATALETIISKFEDLDSKVIKTKEDIQALNDTLASASDNISDVKASDEGIKIKKNGKLGGKYNKLKKKRDNGTATLSELAALRSAEEFNGSSAREAYNISEDKEQFLKDEVEYNRLLAQELRDNQLKLIDEAVKKGEITLEEKKKEINAAVNAKIYSIRDEIADKTGDKEAATAAANVVKSIVSNMSAQEQRNLYDDEQSIIDLFDKVDKITVKIGNDSIQAAKVLESDTYTFAEKMQAYFEILEQFGEDSAEAMAFKTLYHELSDLADITKKDREEMLAYIDSMQITTKQINDFKDDLKDLGFEDLWDDIFKGLSSGMTVSEVMDTFFGDLDKESNTYNSILNIFEKLIGDSALNISQSVTKMQNEISSVYDTALKWSTMSKAEQGAFISEHAALFKGNPDLYEAFKTGNLSIIEDALKKSKSLTDDIKQQIKTIDAQLDIERKRQGDERNEALIAYLEDQKKALEDEENFYKASLDIRVELEKKQLDIYKDYLKKQQEALTEALEKRKDAYSKYFEAVNQEQEDAEYEKQTGTLVSNLSKLASSSDAASKQQAKELEQQLKELEQDRIKELRERAQEAVLQNLDDQVEQINKKFDKLLENNQNLLTAMLLDEENKTDFISDMISSSVAGMTANEAMKWFETEFQTTFGYMLPRGTADIVEETIKNIILNIGGDNIQLTTEQQNTIREAIAQALREVGLR